MLPIKFERPSVDEQCLRLAEHFLSAEPHTEDDVWSLADAIQKLVERSRALGASMLAHLRRLQAKHAVIGDVRGGRGLFAVVELVADRATRAPHQPWPQSPPALRALVDAAMAAGVSFAVRGNLVILAPPLVIGEQELADALDLLDRLLAEHFP